MNDPICIAKIINTHGCRGTVKAEFYANSAEDLIYLQTVYIRKGQDFEPHRVLHAGVHKGFLLLDLEGVQDMNAAEALKNVELFASRSDFTLDENEYFEEDVIGKPVIDLDTGVCYGTVQEIENRGAQDLYVVVKDGQEHLLPARPEFIGRVTDEALFVTPIPGLLDDEI